MIAQQIGPIGGKGKCLLPRARRYAIVIARKGFAPLPRYFSKET